MFIATPEPHEKGFSTFSEALQKRHSYRKIVYTPASSVRPPPSLAASARVKWRSSILPPHISFR